MRRGGLWISLKRPAWLTLVFGLILSVMLFVWASRHEQQSEHAKFERRAQFRVVAVERGMANAIEALRVLNQLFMINGSVSREQFQSFVQPLRTRYPYIEAFAFSRVVYKDQRSAFEAQMGKLFPGFTIDDLVDGKRVVAAVKDRYRVISYLEPMARNDSVLGVDASSLRFQDDAVRRAEDTGLPSATGLFRRPRDSSGKRGISILMPVYEGGRMPDDVASRRLAVIGYTVATLSAGDLIEKILASAGSSGNADFDIRVYAAAAADNGNLVYGKATAAGDRSRLLPAWLFGDRQEVFSDNFEVAGTTWRMVVAAQPMSFAAAHANALIVFLISLLIALLATAYLQSVVMRGLRIQRLVAQRTDELKQVNALLIDDIKARKLAEEAQRHSRSKIRKLANHQERIKEDERKRIARDIHDDLGQSLIALRIDASRMAAHPGSAVTAEWIGAVVQQIDATIATTRNIINDLRPAVLDIGLHAAVEWQANEFERRTGIPCKLHIDHEEFALDDKCATALFRIVQESLTNIIRHADASLVQIEMNRKDNRLFVSISDDGIGLSPVSKKKENAFGLAGMKERIHALGGTFFTTSNPDLGTTIMLSIPI